MLQLIGSQFLVCSGQEVSFDPGAGIQQTQSNITPGEAAIRPSKIAAERDPKRPLHLELSP
jgi:hypothetical protein